MSPSGLNILRCHKVLLHTGLHYRAQPGEGVFFIVKNVIGSISAAEHYLPGTSCPTSKNSDAVCVKHLQQKQASTLRVQQLVPAFLFVFFFFFFNILLDHNHILNTVCVRWILLLQISLLWEGSLMS